MKRLPIAIVCIIVIINVFLHLSANEYCMDNSWYLCKRYDYKEYHPVECNCDCSKYKQLSDRGRCAHCSHYHMNGDQLKSRTMKNNGYTISLAGLKANAKRNKAQN